jgi:hypothetical protein
MWRLRTIRRLLIRSASLVLILSGLSLYVVHTRPVRHFALGQIQAFLRKTRGLVLEVNDFDYNLLSSRFELRQVDLKWVSSLDMPPPLTAQRVFVSIPVWQLALGSLDTARIRIDGLGVYWITASGGRSNWPSMGGRKAGGISVRPTILVTSGELSIQDGRNGFSLHLPHGQVSTAWQPAKNEYSIAFNSSGGQLQWNKARLALDELQLRSALGGSGFSVQSLQLVISCASHYTYV